MSSYICGNCYKISKEKLASCPKCGATNSFMLTEEFATLRNPKGPAGPVGAGTGGIMPRTLEEYLPPLPITPNEAKKESGKKPSKKKRAR